MEKEQYFVVGTAGLSIFTLLRLYELLGDNKYLESAKLAGDWLILMQNENSSMKPYKKFSNEKWTYGTKESLLYNGQVLSALSKLYAVTNEEKYFKAAEKIALRFTEKYEQEKGYIQGDYRTKNPISNAWVVMSLMDFYKVSPKQKYYDVIFELSSKILENQNNDKDDIMYYGSWGGAFSSSGMGWISEVMTDTYHFCKEQIRNDCDKYRQAVVKVIRWIIQNTYSEENVYLTKNPERALGGVFWNRSNKYVRTDSVCHALNGYVRIINDLENGILLSIP